MKHKLRKIVFIAATTALLGWTSVQSAGAATITVTNTADSGAGSLRDALAGAADGDIIDATGVSGTILLTSGQLDVSNSVTILGPGPGQLVVDGNATDGNTTNRVFYISSNLTAVIAGLTVTNGMAPYLPDVGTYGGGIWNDHSILTISNCNVSGNSAGNGGGGIYNSGKGGRATLNVIATTLSGNSAFYLSIGSDASVSGGTGGGIYNDAATVLVINSTLNGNLAVAGGGGIYSDGSSGSARITVIASSISDNSTTFNDGGGIENEDSTLLVTNSTISGNSAAYHGGGIFNGDEYSGIFNGDNVSVTVVASTVNGNSAYQGGGIGSQCDVAGAAMTVTLINSTISDDSATAQGGGIYDQALDAYLALTVNSCTFTGNTTSNNSGGAIYSETNTMGDDSAASTVDIGNTILKAGATGGTIADNGGGMVTSHGFNLSSDDGGGFLHATGDQINKDPLLGPLADNGGPTLTHLPLPGSPAIDQGLSDAIPLGVSTTDQRGFPRTIDDPTIPNAPYGDGTDIGSVEVGPTNHPPVAICQNVTVLAGPGGTADASINNGSYDPDAGDTITVTQTPPGPYPIGTTPVTLKVTDNHGLSDSCTANVTVEAVADLRIGMAVASSSGRSGQMLTYTITVENFGPNPASGVVVNDAVPTGTTFSSASPAASNAPPVGAAGTVVWNIGSLNSGGSATCTLKILASPKGSILIPNAASVTESSFDPNLANNTVSVTSRRIIK